MGGPHHPAVSMSNQRSAFKCCSAETRDFGHRGSSFGVVGLAISFSFFFTFLLTTELRLEEKGGAPNTNGHTRNLGFKYREEGVKYLRAARDIEEEVKSDVFLAACMMMSNADVSRNYFRFIVVGWDCLCVDASFLVRISSGEKSCA